MARFYFETSLSSPKAGSSSLRRISVPVAAASATVIEEEVTVVEVIVTEPVSVVVAGLDGMLVGPVVAVAVLADAKQEASLSSQSEVLLDLSLRQV
jgi:hypothetical protein